MLDLVRVCWTAGEVSEFKAELHSTDHAVVKDTVKKVRERGLFRSGIVLCIPACVCALSASCACSLIIASHNQQNCSGQCPDTPFTA